MKKVTIVLIAALFVVPFGLAGEHEHQPKKNALFERLQPLAGTWEATVQGQKLRTTFSVGSHGSTLVEHFWPDGENMLNVIHADGDALMMTHYCAGANQPRLRAARFDGNKIDFKFVDGTNIGNEYMSGVTITLVDADHMTQEWRSTKDGKEKPDMVFQFVRVK